jgi:alpha-1,2-mannosyltransferase
VDNTSGHLQRFAPGALLLLLALFLVLAVARPLLRPYAWSDFATFYSAAETFAAGDSPYTLESLQRTGQDDFSGWIGRYLYPPPFAAIVVRPLTAFPFDVARRLWVVVETLAYLTSLVLLAGVVFGRLDRFTLLATAVVGLTWAPFGLDLRLGSVSGILLLLLVVFLFALRRQRDWIAAIALGGAVLLKVSPAIVVALLLLRGRWRLALGAGVTVLLLSLASLPLTGIQAWSDYLTQVVPVLTSANFSWFTNQSLDALFWRLFMPNPDTTPWVESVWLYRSSSVAASAAVLGVLSWWAWRRRSTHRAATQELLWLSSLSLVAALLVARVTWEYMTVLAIPCLLLWMRHVWRHPTRFERLLLLSAWFLCAAPFPYTQAPLRDGIGLLLESPRLWGLLLLFVSAIRVGRRQAAVESTQQDEALRSQNP